MTFINGQRQNYHARGDYKEVLDLCAVFLDENCEEKYKIIAPGALHRARWMAPIIYTIKIFLYRKQLNLNSDEILKLGRFIIFILKIHIQNWFTCQSAALAPKNDLDLVKSLLKYQKSDLVVATAALNSFKGHLWYLSGSLIGLSLFDDRVPDIMKQKIVNKMMPLSE